MENIVKCNRNLIKQIFYLIFEYKYNKEFVNENNKINLTRKE